MKQGVKWTNLPENSTNTTRHKKKVVSHSSAPKTSEVTLRSETYCEGSAATWTGLMKIRTLTTQTRCSIQMCDKVVIIEPRSKAVRASIRNSAHEVIMLTVACRITSAVFVD